MWGRHIDDYHNAWEIVRRADHPQIGLILDSYHTLARGIDPESIHRIPGEKIFFVQLADAPEIRIDVLYLSRHFRCMPGEGSGRARLATLTSVRFRLEPAMHFRPIANIGWGFYRCAATSTELLFMHLAAFLEGEGRLCGQSCHPICLKH